jgi:hypothetical protein
LFSLVLLIAFLLAGCGSPANAPLIGSCTLPLEPNATDADKITALLRAEGELVVAQSIDALMALWAPGGEVVDAKHTPNDTADDQRWIDLDAVRHRYVRIVFPGNPQPAPPPELDIAISGDSAAITATTRIGDEIAPGGDRWDVVKVGDCWAIQRLSYNNEE